jgi:hypothetical protein
VGHKDKVKRLERVFGEERWDLVCSECGWETTVFGDMHLDLVVLDWEASQPVDSPGEHSTFSPHPSVVELANHEHPAEAFIEKKSGLNIYDPSLSGMTWDVGMESPQADEDPL